MSQEPNEPRHPDVWVQLTGEDGNAFAILGRTARALRQAGLSAGLTVVAEDQQGTPRPLGSRSRPKESRRPHVRYARSALDVSCEGTAAHRASYNTEPPIASEASAKPSEMGLSSKDTKKELPVDRGDDLRVGRRRRGSRRESLATVPRCVAANQSPSGRRRA
jgi:hypothetical protein